jgi:23S rRNA maturation mini-RNase III
VHNLGGDLVTLRNLRRQAEALPELAGSLREEYDEAARRGRAAGSRTAWLDAQVTQAAVASALPLKTSQTSSTCRSAW